MNEKWKQRLQQAFKILRTSLVLTVALAAGSVIYAFFTHGRFWPVYVFSVNMIAGGFIVAAGLVVFMLPFAPKESKLLDHTTYAEKMMEAREIKRKRAYFLLYIGIANLTITMLAQLLLSLIWQ